MRKLLALSLFFVLTACLPIDASFATTVPSVPEFTLQYVDNSYNVPPTTNYTTDPYTGKVTTTTVPGYYVEKISVQVIITNPPFSSYKDENGSNIDLYYQVLIKGHYEETWAGISNNRSGYDLFNDTSSTTIIHAAVYNISAGGMVDVQVRALIGSFVTVYDPPVPAFNVIPSHDVFVGEASDWSTVQTITIGDTSTITTSGPSPSSSVLNPPVSPSQSPASTSADSSDSILGFNWVILVLVVLLTGVVVLLVLVVFYLRRRNVASIPPK